MIHQPSEKELIDDTAGLIVKNYQASILPSENNPQKILCILLKKKYFKCFRTLQKKNCFNQLQF